MSGAVVFAEPSPAFSFKGWLFGVWVANNKKEIKAFLVVLCAWATALLSTVQPPEARVALVGLVGIVSKFGFDALDYWITARGWSARVQG